MKRIDQLRVVWLCIGCAIQAEEISHVKYIYFTQGETVLLQCKTDVNKVVWQGPAHRNSSDSSPINTTDVYGRPKEWHTSVYATNQIVNPSLTHQNRLTIVDRTEMGGGFNLQIRNVSGSDQGLYICQYTCNTSLSIFQFVLQQKILPSKIMFSNETKEHSLNGIENSTMRIVCSVKSGKPPEVMLLRRNNEIVKIGTHGRIELTFKATKLDHNVNYTCEAHSSLLKNPLKRNVHINIKYKPLVSIMDSITLYISEGSKKNVCCKVDSSPAPISTRLVNGSKDIFLKHNVQNICYQFDKVSRYDQGNYTCIAENEIGSSSTTISLKVTFPPDIHIHYKNFTIHDELRKIQCKPEGFPVNYTYGVWEHESEFNEHIRYLNSTANGTLILPKVTEASDEYQDSGIYICKATNGVPNEQHFQQGKAYVVSQGPPVFVYQNSAIQYGMTGNKVNIRVYLLSYLKIECIAITAIDGLEDDNYVLDTYTKHLKVMAIFHGKTISVNGIEVAFVFTRLQQKHFRLYRITVCNTFGNESYTLSLVPKADNSAEEEHIISSERTVIIVLLILIMFLLVLMCLYVRYLKNRFRKRRITPTTGQTADSAHYMEITEDNIVMSTLQERNNPITSTADINIVEIRNTDLILEEDSSASSGNDNNVSGHVDDGYEKPYTILLALNHFDNTHDYQTTASNPSNKNPVIFVTDDFGTTSMYETKPHAHSNARYENVNLKSDENNAEYINLSLNQ